MTLYKKRYRVETARLQDHAYDKGAYFVTICTKKKLQWFGEVKNGKMLRSNVGEIVADEWIKTFTIRPYLRGDEWCVMPNHIHGIIEIDDVETSRGDVSLSDTSSMDTTETRAPRVSVKRDDEVVRETRAPRVSTQAAQNFSLKTKTLGSIINQFKGIVTKRARAEGYLEFQWQARYHDRIIRSDQERAMVKKYISRNPNTWDKETIPWHADAASWSL